MGWFWIFGWKSNSGVFVGIGSGITPYKILGLLNFVTSFKIVLNFNWLSFKVLLEKQAIIIRSNISILQNRWLVNYCFFVFLIVFLVTFVHKNHRFDWKLFDKSICFFFSTLVDVKKNRSFPKKAILKTNHLPAVKASKFFRNYTVGCFRVEPFFSRELGYSSIWTSNSHFFFSNTSLISPVQIVGTLRWSQS